MPRKGTSLHRRTLLGTGIAAGLGLRPSHPVRAADAPQTTATLRVATWGGTWMQLLQQYVEPALHAHGTEVSYVLGQPDDNLAKLIAARGQTPPIDLIEYSENDRSSMLGAGVLAPIDYAHVPNAHGVQADWRLPDMVANSSTLDGIVYNADRFKEAGLAPPRTYADLADPQLRDRLAFGDITTPQGVKGLIAIAYENGGSETNLAPGMQAILRLRPRNLLQDLDADTDAIQDRRRVGRTLARRLGRARSPGWHPARHRTAARGRQAWRPEQYLAVPGQGIAQHRGSTRLHQPYLRRNRRRNWDAATASVRSTSKPPTHWRTTIPRSPPCCRSVRPRSHRSSIPTSSRSTWTLWSINGIARCCTHDPARMSKVSLRGVTLRYGSVTALHPLDLDIAQGEFVTLLGPSGCGKTTTLRLIAGFIMPTPDRSCSTTRMSAACRRTAARSAWCSRTTRCSHT